MGGVNFMRDDGGRAQAGFSGQAAGDCVTRAIAIASGRPYREVYDAINEIAQEERPRRKPGQKRGRKRSNSRTGVHRRTYEKYIKSIGGVWKPLMSIGSGCTVHVKDGELPKDRRLILSLSRHLAAYIGGWLRDNHDCSRGGTRCVYGYYDFGPVDRKS